MWSEGHSWRKLVTMNVASFYPEAQVTHGQDRLHVLTVPLEMMISAFHCARTTSPIYVLESD